MKPPPPVITAEASCRAAVELMREQHASRVLVVAADGQIVGILSAGDILHRGDSTDGGSMLVQSLMTRPTHIVGEDELLFRAVDIMQRQSLSQVPVLDAAGSPRGMVALQDIIIDVLDGELPLIHSIARSETPADLRHAKDLQKSLAAILLEQHVPTKEVLNVLSTLNDEIYRRVLEHSIQELVDEGREQPPVDFAVIVMGSGGRRESLLYPDQDNGFVIEDYPDSQYLAVDDYFCELAIRMNDRLDDIGLPRCVGHVMASNPSWRKRVSEWKAQLRGWMHKPSRASTILMDICVDFRCVAGNQHLVETVREFLIWTIPSHRHFLQELARLQFNHDVAITPLGTLKRERLPGKPGHRKIDVKRKGILLLVEGVRILALREGSDAGDTLGRVGFLREQGIIHSELADDIERAFCFLTDLLLRRQIQNPSGEHVVAAYIAPESLSRWERTQLKDSLKTATRLRGMVHTEFTGELF